jgi:hypothetical protein
VIFDECIFLAVEDAAEFPVAGEFGFDAEVKAADLGQAMAKFLGGFGEDAVEISQ